MTLQKPGNGFLSLSVQQIRIAIDSNFKSCYTITINREEVLNMEKRCYLLENSWAAMRAVDEVCDHVELGFAPGLRFYREMVAVTFIAHREDFITIERLIRSYEKELES